MTQDREEQKKKFYIFRSFLLNFIYFSVCNFFSVVISQKLVFHFILPSFSSENVGRRIFHYIKTRNIRGETGQVAFDDNGDRMFAEYEVINVRDHQRKKIVGKLLYDMVCVVTHHRSKFFIHRL